ncbi:Cysteine proteinase inhibitor 10 [Morus notabilis]|uniref:Cysteine proteinase inhibitor 10 n=2 Tax=Morus TaxID=3497 RepID=W9RET1_9ROSA|nr:cysteine proteinase inhibitor B [Morus notabilis]AJD79057.1 CPI-6 [Morus alba var. atropurpurea]EXB87085.1 Cysteine proteinase inhibitor 10 [Morus notabilis]
MAMISSPAVIFSLLTLLIFSPACGHGRSLVGGRTAISDVKTNEEVQELGRFSVEEYNRRSQKLIRRGNGGARDGYGDGELSFSQVVEAEKQVVSGIKYYLKVSATATETGESRIFDSVVVVKPWLRSRQLLNFAPSTARDVHF